MLTNIKINQTLKTSWKTILDAIFPTFCLACQQEGRGWCCDECWLKLNFKRTLTCPACGLANPLGEWCGDCRQEINLAGLWYSQNYADPTIRSLIYGLKYQGITDLTKQLADILAITLRIFSLPPAWHPVNKNDWLLVPVPLTKKRQRERGFNQAELLCQPLSKSSCLTWLNALDRHKFNQPQAELPESERYLNVKNAFAIKEKINITNRTIILVDDVFTSGCTMNECAKVLLQGGAREIWGLVVAKG